MSASGPPMSASEVETFVQQNWDGHLQVGSTISSDDVAPTIDEVECDGGLEAAVGDRVRCDVEFTRTDGESHSEEIEVEVVEGSGGELEAGFPPGRPTGPR